MCGAHCRRPCDRITRNNQKVACCHRRTAVACIHHNFFLLFRFLFELRKGKPHWFRRTPPSYFSSSDAIGRLIYGRQIIISCTAQQKLFEQPLESHLSPQQINIKWIVSIHSTMTTMTTTVTIVTLLLLSTTVIYSLLFGLLSFVHSVHIC